jgi:exosome complex component MTR3
MPDNRRIQGPEESHNPDVFLKPSEKPGNPDLLNQEGCRIDGRKPEEIRPIYMKTGLNDRASGSAYVELGATKVMCAV